MDRLLSEQEVIRAVNKHTIPSVEIILSEDITAILKEVSSAEPKWIPVSERLPENGQSVLFCDIDNDIMVGYHVKGRPETHFSQDGTYEDIKDVRAWMPLPEPYKAESEDKND